MMSLPNKHTHTHTHTHKSYVVYLAHNTYFQTITSVTKSGSSILKNRMSLSLLGNPRIIIQQKGFHKKKKKKKLGKILLILQSTGVNKKFKCILILPPVNCSKIESLYLAKNGKLLGAMFP